MFRSNSQPHCRCCGKPIRKRTVKHVFGQHPDYLANYSWLKGHAEKPATRAECQRWINDRILKIAYTKDRRSVREAIAWDGESYDDEFFCTGTCANAFGRMAAREYPRLLTQDAADAAIKRRS